MAMDGEIKTFDYIDALRGYAILAVVSVHCAQYLPPQSAILGSMAHFGAKGVQLFYVASALTLGLSWQSRSGRERTPIRNFYIRRFFRIAPMFYLAIAFYSLLRHFPNAFLSADPVSWWQILLTASFLNGLFPETINLVVPGGWSIAVEMSFYSVLPFLVTYIRTTRSACAFLIVSILLDILSTIIISHAMDSNQEIVREFIYLNFFGQLPVFAFGILAYEVIRIHRLRSQDLFFGWLLVCISVILALRLGGKPPLIAIQIFFGYAFALLAVTLSRVRSSLAVNRLVCGLGKVSYSMYLSHFAVIAAFSYLRLTTIVTVGDVPFLLFFASIVAVSGVISWLSYRFIELPGMRFGRWLIEQQDQPNISPKSASPLR